MQHDFNITVGFKVGLVFIGHVFQNQARRGQGRVRGEARQHYKWRYNTLSMGSEGVYSSDDFTEPWRLQGKRKGFQP